MADHPDQQNSAGQPIALGDEIRQRYPRLLRLLQSRCRLSEDQALEVLVSYQVFGITDGLPWDPITLCFGGPLNAIQRAIDQRHRPPA